MAPRVPIPRKTPKSEAGLKPRERLFAFEYLIDMDPKAACIRAGYGPTNAKLKGQSLLENPQIAGLVEVLLNRRKEKLEIKAEQILQELARVALLDIADFYDEHGALLPIHEIPEDARRAIASVDVEEIFEGRGADRTHIGTMRKVKTHSKMDALTTAMRHLGLLKDKLEVSGKLTLEQLINESFKEDSA